MRDDYKELDNLCLSYLGDPEHISKEPALQSPDAESEESDLQHLGKPHEPVLQLSGKSALQHFPGKPKCLQCPGKPDEPALQCPGALHDARWRAI